MPTTVNRTSYVQLIDEDLAWLGRQPRTLERDHIEQVLAWSIRVLYDGEPGDAFGDPAREVERLRAAIKRHHHRVSRKPVR